MSPYYFSYANFPITHKVFHRPFNELSSYRAVNMEDGTVKLFVNAIGVKSEDIDIGVDNYNDGHLLKVSGKTEVDVIGEHSFEYNFTTKRISKISKHLENGILILTIEFEKPISPDVEIVEL